MDHNYEDKFDSYFSDTHPPPANLLPHPSVLRSRRERRRLAKMFGLVVAIFMVCWAPYHIYFILSYHLPGITRSGTPDT